MARERGVDFNTESGRDRGAEVHAMMLWGWDVGWGVGEKTARRGEQEENDESMTIAYGPLPLSTNYAHRHSGQRISSKHILQSQGG